MDPYVYPGTNVLKNLREIRDLDLLQQFEADVTTLRIKELENSPVPGSFDTRHLKEIHRYIFQDVYSWAGQFRTVSIARAGQFYFARPEYVESSLNRLFGELRKQNHLTGQTADGFATRAGHYLGEINAIHPFREGNGRTQREFIRELARQNGCLIFWSRITPEQMREASRISFQQGNNAYLSEIIRTTLDCSQPGDRSPDGDM